MACKSKLVPRFIPDSDQVFRHWKAPAFLVAFILGFFALCPAGSAQSGAGSIQGTVTDSTGAVIPRASIHVVNQATNVTTNTRSNEVGFYQVPGLFAGSYVVTISAPGFKTYRTRLQLLVAQAGIINASLTTGLVTQQVEVNANAVQLTTTDNGTITSTLENARINQLPLNGRVLSSLLSMTTPGLEGSSAGGTRLNGLAGEALEYVADGVPMVNRQFGGTNTSQEQAPDPDAIQEVQAETTNSSAQYSTPGTVVIDTKSGTNEIHGAFFWTARNNAIGIAKARQDPANFTAPKYIRNEIGGSAGGPIVFPHLYHGKNKSFWFIAYERYSLASASSQLFHVPTQAMRNGDFSALADLAGKPILYDPNTTYNAAVCPATDAANPYCRKSFTQEYNEGPGNPTLCNGDTNCIPANRESPTMKLINDLTPMPNLPYDPLLQPNLEGPDDNFTLVPTWTFRIDQVFNQNNRAYLRYTSNVEVNHSLRDYPVDEPALGGADGFPANATGQGYNPIANFAPAIGFTHVFSPSFFSETIFSQEWLSQHNYAGGTPFADFEKKLGLPNNFGEGGFPRWGENPSSDRLINPIDGTQFIYGLSQIISNLDENLTKTVGRHQMFFGGRYRHERFGYLPDENADDNQFSTQATGLYDTSTGANYGGLPNIGNQNGDAFLGAANYYSVNLEPPYAHFHDMEFDAYFQDDYHMTRNLTWNLGLRWESHPATWLKGGTMETFDLNHDALALASTPAQLIANHYTTQAIITNMQNIGVKFETFSQAGIPSKGTDNYNLNFSPRVGFAWQPFGAKLGTVIRGAYGRYIYPIPVRTTYKPILQNRPYASGYSQNYSLAAQSPDGIQNYLIRNPQTVIMGQNSADVVDTTSTTAFLPGISVYTLPADEPPDFVTETNFTIEQPLKGNSALRVSWVWSHGTNLDQEFFYNHALSNYAWEIKTGTAPPKGKTIGQPDYQATALNPYDNTTWGNNTRDQKSGWSNDNELEVNYQRLFHSGLAYQIFYVWSKPFRVGGNYFRDGTLYTAADYVNSGLGTMTPLPNSSPITAPVMPPARPAGVASYSYWHQLDTYEDYFIDTSVPIQDVQFNGLVDLPFGRGKRFFGNANRFVNELIGGFQVAGDGAVHSQDFGVSNGNWGPNHPLHVYKHGHKVTDCRSGSCIEAYEWFNGYLAPSNLPSSGCTNVVTGLPSDYQPYSAPINTDYNPSTPCGKAQDKYYNTNDVQINLANGKTDVQGFDPGPNGGGWGINPWAKTFLNGPMNYTVDLSVFKVFPITERVRMRFNADAFNALNVQGYNNPSNSDGIENMLKSYNTPRQIQLTMRLEF